MFKHTIFLFVLLTFNQIYAQAPEILSIDIKSEEVQLYEKYEAVVDLEAHFENPYDYDQVSLKAFILKPDGSLDTIDGFYTEQLKINLISGQTQSEGPDVFKIRYAPYAEGTYQYTLSLTDSTGSVLSEAISFICSGSDDLSLKGYVRMGQTNYLEFDNEEQYIPIGENMAWQENNPYFNYSEWITALSENGGNFMRLWHAHWGLGIEWIPGWNNHLGLKKYNQVASAYQDWLYEYCEEKEVYVMLALQHHGQVSTQVNPNWKDNPYNLSQGGPIANTWEFFTNDEAKALTKNRLRYIVARWGHSRSIMSWELFNEVEWTDNFETHKEDIIDWHIEMAEFIRSIDVYEHLITTSFAHEAGVDRLWENKIMDFTQLHYYNNNPDIHSALVSESNALLDKFKKPVLVGEFGLGGSSLLAQDDLDGVHIHNAIWSTMFGGSMGTAMSWWWESYIHPSDLYYHFAGPSKVVEQLDFIKDNLSSHSARVVNAPSDLILFPTLNWGQVADTLIEIVNGAIIPSHPNLSSFLYGALYNTQFRSPPTFNIETKEEITFSVTIGNDTSTMARIVVALDEDIIIDSLAIPNTTYEILVPPGQHKIKVDNTGKDWLSIQQYYFENLGSKAYVVALLGEEKLSGAGWVLNEDYNHFTIGEGVLPDAIEDAAIIIDDTENVVYSVNWYETLTGELVASEQASAVDQRLYIEIPPLYWDLAFTLSSDGTLDVDELKSSEFIISPNPVRKGGSINIHPIDMKGPFNVNVFNVEGKAIFEVTNVYDGGHVRIPNSIPSGIYWVKVSNGQDASVRPLIVSD